MRKIAVTFAILILLSGFYACVAPTPKSAQATNNPGVFVFTAAYTFPAGDCIQEYEAQPGVIGSSEVTVSWDRDSLGAAANQIVQVRPSADVMKGGVYFVFCNLFTTSVTVPAGATATFQTLNAN